MGVLYLIRRENIQITRAPCILHSLIRNELGNIMALLCTFMHIWAAILCSTSQIRPSWPCPRFRLSSSMLTHASHPIVFALVHLALHCLSQRFIFHTHNPPFTTRGLNTFIQVNIMGVQYTMFNWHVYRSNSSSCASTWSLGRPAGAGLQRREHLASAL